jgi:transposase-like protein
LTTVIKGVPEAKPRIIDMSLNASGIRDTARVLPRSTDTVLSALKKPEATLESVHKAL